MILKRSLKNKLKKFSFLFFIFIFVFSILSMPVSALSNYYDFDFAVSRPGVTSNSGYIEVVVRTANGSLRPYLIMYSWAFINPGEPSSDNADVRIFLRYWDDHTFTLSSNNSNVYISALEINPEGYYYIIDPSTSQQFTYSYGPICSLVPYGAIQYSSDLSLYNTQATVFNYGSDTTTQFILQSILGNLPDNEELASSINDNANQNAADIQDNANQNASDIQDNANQNAADIQANQDKNTSELLNGWQSDEEVSSGDSDSLANAEHDLISGNEEAAKTQINDVNDSVLGSLRRLTSSFAATGSLFRQLTVRVPDFSVLVYFSLAIGILPLIVGLSINGLRSSDRRAAKSKRSKGG